MIINSFILKSGSSSAEATPLVVEPATNNIILSDTVTKQLSLIVPAGTTSMTISTDQNVEASDVKLWADSNAVFTDYVTASTTAAAYSDNNNPNPYNESVTIATPTAGLWKIGMLSIGGDSNINVTASLTVSTHALVANTETDFDAPNGLVSQFTVDIPFGMGSFTITVDAPDADGVISVWADGQSVFTAATDASANAAVFSDDGTGTIEVTGPYEGTWYIGLQLGGNGANPGQITATLVDANVTELTSGVATNFSGAAGDVLQFGIVAPDGALSISMSTDGTDGDVALWFANGIVITDPIEAAARGSAYYSDNDTPNAYTETLSQEEPDPGHYVIGVYIKSAVSAGTITATVE